jgi:asparagine synthase (glutamine-hydrolysing)
MCGIAGYLVTGSAGPRDVTLRSMADAIAHRGPDDQGFLEWSSRDRPLRVGLVHRRLTIIDLSTGHQPMASPDQSTHIVFNGEIYNFRELRDELVGLGHAFGTQSDTEVILQSYQRWGVDCVQRLRGMFAFAIWDAGRERLFAARDRFGKKPLFLYQADGLLLFGSEIKALLASPAVRTGFDTGALCDYLQYRYVPGPGTFFKGIRKLAPGSHLVWENGTVRETRYYEPPDGHARPIEPPPDAPLAAFMRVLDDAVRLRMISDVPFGAFLSGGIDSSAVVALMTRHSSQPIKTFSVGFAEPRYSELGHARQVAQRFGTAHHELIVSHDHLIDHLPALVRFRDAPVAEPSDIPIYLLSVEARRTVKMVLSGEGSDELLGGYPKHVYERWAGRYAVLPAWLRQRLVEPLVGALPYRYHRAKTAVANLALPSWAERMPRWFGALTRAEACSLIADGLMGVDRETTGAGICADAGNTPLRSILHFDQASWLPDNLLERGDRMTMAASLEARMPFMDHVLAELVSSLPDAWRVRGFTTKRILREAMAEILPAPILTRSKVGFRVPVNEWFRGSLRDYLMDHLCGPGSRTRGYYRREVLDRYLAEHQAGRQNHEKLLWALLSLEIFHREFRISA